MHIFFHLYESLPSPGKFRDRKEDRHTLLGLEEEGLGSQCLMCTDFVWDNGTILEMDKGDGCKIL